MTRTKGFIIILCSLFVFICVVAITNNLSKYTQNHINSSTTSLDPAVTTKTDSDEWIEYQDSFWGFTISFPKTWYSEKNPYSSGSSLLETQVMFANVPLPIIPSTDLFTDACRFDI